MSRKPAAVSLFVVTLFLAGCASDVLHPDRVPYQYVPPAAPPNFFVGYTGNAFFPQGLGWVPGSNVEIILVAEPIKVNNELSSANPHVIANVTVDSIGTFGVIGTAVGIPVIRTLCGAPPETLPRPFFMARDKNGNLRFYPGYSDAYFTFVPCH